MSLTVGVDLGGTHIRAVAFDDQLAAVGRAEAPTGAEDGVEAVVARVAGCVTEALPVGEEPAGVGVGAAGLIDPWSGTVVLASNLGWRDVPVRDLVAAALGGYGERAERRLRQRALPALADMVEVMPGALGGEAGTIGAALLLSEDDARPAATRRSSR